MTALDILVDVAQRLEALGIPYAVGGSVASSVWGQMRQSNDIDIAVRLSESDIDALGNAFGEPYHIGIEELRAELQSSQEYRMAPILHLEEAFKINLFLLRDDEYGNAELSRAQRVEVVQGSQVLITAPEDIILAKLRWFVAGNRVSDRQWNDIVNVLDVQDGRLDESYLDFWAAHFRLTELLHSAREQTRLH